MSTDRRGPAKEAGAHPRVRGDVATLLQIVQGLERLDAFMEQSRVSIAARQRGYFTPDEDDRVRQLLLAYRNYRLAGYEIIDRHREYEDEAELRDRLHRFIIGYAAALTIYAKSRKLVRTYLDEPLVRAKLNEPEPTFGVDANFFEMVLERYTSLENYRTMLHAERFWRRHRRDVERLGLTSEEGIADLCQVIHRYRHAIHRGVRDALSDRVRAGARRAFDAVFRPADAARYSLQAFVGGALGRVEAPIAPPCFDRATLAALRPRLRPGDVLLVRTERRLTSALLPGFWIHAAVFLGHEGDLEELGVAKDAAIRPHWSAIRAASQYGCVVHAVSPRVTIAPLEECLEVDHVAVLRPSFGNAHRLSAILEACRHVGKPYDFEFDFNQSHCLVCTGLVYRSYHGRGPVRFSLVKHLGRWALTCDELLAQALPETAGDHAPFELAALTLMASDGHAHLIPDDAALEHLRAIQRGMKPQRDLHAPAAR